MILLSHFVGVFVKYQTSDAMVTASSSIYVTKFQFITLPIAVPSRETFRSVLSPTSYFTYRCRFNLRCLGN
jgi:hypothetical protein